MGKSINMTKAPHLRCGYCGKDLGGMEMEGEETWEPYCSEKHARLADEGKRSPKYKQNLSTATTGKF